MERSSFFNAVLNGETYDRVYLAEDYARYFSSFIGNGVFPTPSTNLQVVADGSTMNITLKAGKGWINGYFYENTDDLTLNVAIADGVLNRLDRIVLRLDFINREIKAYIKKGAFATSPVAPALTRNADVYELGLADIKINKGVTKIVQADITDLRGNSNLCGYVAGVVQQIDTTNLFAQFQSTFDLWFQNVKGQLSTDAAGNLQLQIDTWNDFKNNGGTLFNSMELKSSTTTTDAINTSKSTLNITAKDGGIEITGGGALRPIYNNQTSFVMKLGLPSSPWADVFVGVHNDDTSSGYTKLPNGYILQWIKPAITSVSGGSIGINFPIAFPIKCITCLVQNTPNIAGEPENIIWTVGAMTSTQVTLLPRTLTGAIPTKNVPCLIWALGR